MKRFLLILIALLFCIPANANSSGDVQIILGFDIPNFNKAYPGADFGRFYELATRCGITFYGVDSYLGAKMTGAGLDFTRCEERIPRYLDLLPDGMNPILPVSSYNMDRLADTYAYFNSAGWLDKAEWAIFLTEQSDEVRSRSIVSTYNTYYEQMKEAYPKLKIIVTDTRIPVLPGQTDDKGGLVHGDIIIAQAHHAVFQDYTLDGLPEWVMELLDAEYPDAEYGIYLAGDFVDTGTSDWIALTYYDKVMTEMFGVEAPEVPVFDDGAIEMIPYCIDHGYRYLLFWDGNQFIVPDARGNPRIRMELLELLAGRGVK